MNPANQVTAETFGNGSTQIYQHHQRTFQMQNTKVNGGNLLTQSYNYDLYGNLTELNHQQGNNALRTETFGYDHLHRLTQNQRSGVAPISYSYDAIGNLTEKDDFADSYSYGSGRPNAVSSVTLSGGGTANYGYDANGNMTTAQGNGNSQAAQDVGQLALKYDPYNKPFFIERNGKRSEFWYGPDDQRYFQLENGNQRTVYIDKLYEQIGSTVHKLYLGDYAVFTVDVTSAANSGINYLHKDRLGSIVSITDESGNLIANAGRSFDPFGKPREEDLADSNGITHAPMPDDIGDLNRPDITTRGLTGHEQLNNLSLTHMNGRVYDYNLGRFLSVDPYIAFPEDSQSINPYSYLMNNPMSGTDPSGYLPSICGLGEVSRCEGGAVSYLKEKEIEGKIFQLDVEFNNGGEAHVQFSINSDGGLSLYKAEISNIGSISLRNSIACAAGCAIPAATPTVLGLLGTAFATAMADSPFPGPADAVAIGVLVVGIAAIVQSDNTDTLIQSAGDGGNDAGKGQNQQDLKNLGGTGSPTGPDQDPSDDEELIELSKAKFGHTFSRHGEASTEFLLNRAKATGQPQGQFLDNQAAARIIQANLHKTGKGAVSVPLPSNFPARIIHPDGRITRASTIRIVPGRKGVKTAYPEP